MDYLELGGGPPKETKNKQQQQERFKLAENLENKYEWLLLLGYWEKNSWGNKACFVPKWNRLAENLDSKYV